MPVGTGWKECGGTASNAIPCNNNQVGMITKNCVMTGYDPPPLLRPDVMLSLSSMSVTNPLPWIKLPTIGSTQFYQGAGNMVVAGSCTPPYVTDNSGNPIAMPDPTKIDNAYAPNICHAVVMGNTPTTTVTIPPPTPCPIPSFAPLGAPTPSNAPSTCDPPGYTDPPSQSIACDDPSTGIVPTFAPGCYQTTVPALNPPVNGVGTPYTYCVKNIGLIPQACGPNVPPDAAVPACPSVPAANTYQLPGFNCGGAVPLIDPAPMDFPQVSGSEATMAAPACPPDDWCIDPSRSSFFRDGYIHLAQPPKIALHPEDGTYTYPAGVYNITIEMGQNNLEVGGNNRVVTIPPMGECQAGTPWNGASGNLVLSNGYAYAILPPSVAPNCYGPQCGYPAPSTTNQPAPYPLDYTTPYQPFGAFASPPSYLVNETGDKWWACSGTPPTCPSPSEPSMTIPYIDVPPGTAVYFSLRAFGSIDLPKGATIATPEGGLVSVPAGGWIESEGDGSTVLLDPGTGYLLAGGTLPGTGPSYAMNYPSQPPLPASNANMQVAGTGCYLQLLPPNDPTIAQVTSCTSTYPFPTPVPTPAPSGSPTSLPAPPLIANPSIVINTTAIGVPAGSPLPPFTSQIEQRPGTTSGNAACPPTDITGATVEPDYCIAPEQFDSATQTCVTLTATCAAPGDTPGNPQFIMCTKTGKCEQNLSGVAALCGNPGSTMPTPGAPAPTSTPMPTPPPGTISLR